MKHLKHFENYQTNSIGLTNEEIKRIDKDITKYPTLNSFVNSLSKLIVIFNSKGLTPSGMRMGIRELYEIHTINPKAIYSFLNILGKKGQVSQEVKDFFIKYDDYLKEDELFQWGMGILNGFNSYCNEALKKSFDVDKLVLESSQLFK